MRGSGCLGSDFWGTQAPSGAGVHLQVGMGAWVGEGLEAVNISFRFSLSEVSPERYNYGTSSGSSSKRTEGSRRRRRQSSGTSEVQQGQWETGEP